MIYLDNSATTSVSKLVYEAMLPYFTQEYGNPSSKYYALAVHASQAVAEARARIAHLIGAKPEEIIFTCGSTESNNTIIKGVADYKKYYDKRGNHIITSAVEHHATLNTCRFLNGEIYSNSDATFSLNRKSNKVDRGYTVTFLPVNCYGQVEGEEFERAITSQTTIASILWGNNEIGSLNDIEALGQIAREQGVFFHSDATQALGKININVQKIPVDALSFSAHKLGGPKGIGALWVRSDDYGIPPFTSLLHGGEQEGGIRGGTLNVPAIVGFGKAAQLAMESDWQEGLHRDREVTTFLGRFPWLKLLGDPDRRIPGIYSVAINIPEFNNELFMKQVGEEIAISAGSACTAGQPSHVLQAIGCGHQTTKVLRISLYQNAGVQDVAKLIQRLEDIYVKPHG